MIIDSSEDQAILIRNRHFAPPEGFVDVTQKTRVPVYLKHQKFTLWLNPTLRERLTGMNWWVTVRTSHREEKDRRFFIPVIYAYGSKDKLLMLKLSL